MQLSMAPPTTQVEAYYLKEEIQIYAHERAKWSTTINDPPLIDWFTRVN